VTHAAEQERYPQSALNMLLQTLARTSTGNPQLERLLEASTPPVPQIAWAPRTEFDRYTITSAWIRAVLGPPDMAAVERTLAEIELAYVPELLMAEIVKQNTLGNAHNPFYQNPSLLAAAIERGYL